MHPKASDTVRVLRQSRSHTVFCGPDDTRVTVDSFAGRVWELADGTRPAAAIARILAADGVSRATVPRVWSALDLLADFGLLAGRASPPAGAAPSLPRRTAIRRGMAIAAGAASLMLTGALTSGSVDAQPANQQGEASSKEVLAKRGKLNAEHQQKQSAERRMKQGAEQQQKHSAEQQQKQGAEQHSKQSAEQERKQGSEQSRKPGSEQNRKQGAEQQAKHNAEQQVKRSAEQRSKK
jgi:hypothetical protein